MKKREIESDVLTLQKKAVKQDVVGYFALSVIFLFITTPLPVITLIRNESFDWGLWYLLGAGLFCVIYSLLIALIRRPLIKKLNEIESSDEQTVLVNCKKISFSFTHPSNTSRAEVLLCVTIKDDEGNKFYYVFPSCEAPHRIKSREIRKALVGKTLALVCYQGANIIKQQPLEITNTYGIKLS